MRGIVGLGGNWGIGYKGGWVGKVVGGQRCSYPCSPCSVDLGYSRDLCRHSDNLCFGTAFRTANDSYCHTAFSDYSGILPSLRSTVVAGSSHSHTVHSALVLNLTRFSFLTVIPFSACPGTAVRCLRLFVARLVWVWIRRSMGWDR